jgi:hypothetical protein
MFWSICGSVGSGVGLVFILFRRGFVHWVELSLISWLHWVGVGTNVIIIA